MDPAEDVETIREGSNQEDVRNDECGQDVLVTLHHVERDVGRGCVCRDEGYLGGYTVLAGAYAYISTGRVPMSETPA